MTDAECVDAMVRGLEVEAVGSVLVPPGARFRLVGYRFGFGFANARIWKKDRADFFGFFARELTLVVSGALVQVASATLAGDVVYAKYVKGNFHRPQSASPPHYPHVCPTCKAPAYIGFSKVDCSAGCP